jgi:hypothetical protein
MSDVSHPRPQPQCTNKLRFTELERAVASNIAYMIAAREREGISVAKRVINIAREYPNTQLAVFAARIALAQARHEAQKAGGWQ